MPKTVRDLLAGVIGEDTLQRKLQSAYERLILECRRKDAGDTSLPSQLSELESLVKQTGIQPDLPARFVQDAYKAYVKRGIPQGVPALSSLTGITPELPEQDVKKAYDAYLREGWVDSLKILHEQTGVDFAFPEHLVQQAYLRYMQEDLLDALAALREVTRIKPQLPENLVHAAYVSYVSGDVINWSPSALKLLQDETGIAPHANLVQDAYERVLQPGRIGVIFAVEIFVGLYESTGIKPVQTEQLEKAVQAVYAKGISRAFCDDSPEHLLLLADVVGIKPSGAEVERAVQEAYKRQFDWVLRDIVPEVMSERMMQLYDFTGITAALPRQLIDAAFRKDPYRRSIHVLSKITGIPVTDALFQNGVQDAYAYRLGKAKTDEFARPYLFKDFQDLYEKTGIEPSKQSVRNLLQLIASE